MKRPQAIPRVEVDSAHVKVTEWRFPPGAESGWHSRPVDYVVVPMTTGALTLETARGRAQALLEAGLSYTLLADVERNVINANEHEFVFVEIEAKSSAPG